MSRLKRYAHSLASGYAALAANVLYSLASVPVAMHYLSNEEFGLWVLAAQVSTYLALAELGMSGSIARILIDHKDNPNDGIYGAVIKTGSLVLVLQGVAIGLLGAILSIWLAGLFEVPVGFLGAFRWLVGGQSAILGLTFGARIFGFILQAHHRYDAFNYSQIGSFALSLLVLWIGFERGMGIYSLLAASSAGMLFTAAFTWLASQRLRLMPAAGQWGKSNWTTFRELAGYASEIFLLSIGQQLITTSQVFVVSRTLGLGAAAVWGVATKGFMLGQQVVWRILDFSAAAFSEMVVRGEIERLRSRFRDVVILTASLSAVAGLAIALCNGSFVEIWTKGRISWQKSNDLLMAVYIAIYSTTRCYTGFIGLTKQIRAMKYIYLVEGVSFVMLALLAAPRFGFGGVIGSGIVTNACCSGVYGMVRTKEFLSIHLREMLTSWLKFPARLFMVMLAAAAAIWLVTRSLPPALQLIVDATATVMAGSYSLWLLGLPDTIRHELAALLLRFRQRWLPAPAR
jgi:O-antigen/teichoic acid export membrane protein